MRHPVVTYSCTVCGRYMFLLATIVLFGQVFACRKSPSPQPAAPEAGVFHSLDINTSIPPCFRLAPCETTPSRTTLLRRHLQRHPPSALGLPCSLPAAYRTATSLGAHPVPSIHRKLPLRQQSELSSPRLRPQHPVTKVVRLAAARSTSLRHPHPFPTPPLTSPRPLSPTISPPPLLSFAPWTPRASVGWHPLPPARVLAPIPPKVAARGRRIHTGWVRACRAEGTMRATRRSAVR